MHCNMNIQEAYFHKIADMNNLALHRRKLNTNLRHTSCAVLDRDSFFRVDLFHAGFSLENVVLFINLLIKQYIIDFIFNLTMIIRFKLDFISITDYINHYVLHSKIYYDIKLYSIYILVKVVHP